MTDATIANMLRLPSTSRIAEYLTVWKNPIVWKNFQSRMRMQSVFSFLLVFVLATFMTFTTYGGIMRLQGDPVAAARTAIVPLAILQWIILMLSATGRITSGIIHERVTGTIEYTRLTPLSPLDKVIGYLFGLPVREYLLFLLTMPFMIFLLVIGEIPISVVIPVYLVFFSSAILFHMLGMVLGLVLKEWRLSVVFTIGLVIAVNWVLPFFSYLGFPFLQYLTVRPVFAEKITPLLPTDAVPQLEDAPALITDLTTGVDFYVWEVSTTAFCLILQGLIVFTLALMVYRKWENDFGHSLSKTYAMFFYIALQLFCIGTLWPNLVFNSESLIAAGLMNDDSLIEEFAFIIPLSYGFFSIGVVYWLVYVTTPSHEDYRSGLLRSQKLVQMNQQPLSRFDDQAGGLLTTSFLAIATFLFILVVEIVMTEMGPLGEVSPDTMGLLRLPMIAMLVIFYFAISLEYLQLSRFALLFLMVWIVPILLAVFLGVALEMEEEVLYIASGSPLTMVVLAAQGLLNDWMNEGEIAIVRNSFWTGTLFILSITAVLGYQLQKQRQRVKQLVSSQQ
ncbi:MAG: ABC transporter permease [Pseudomonadales bacterium]|nr:ABC transporter permease [Pseudomonadales bacterium]